MKAASVPDRESKREREREREREKTLLPSAGAVWCFFSVAVGQKHRRMFIVNTRNVLFLILDAGRDGQYSAHAHTK